MTINSFGDFERSHGGLNTAYPVSYAIRDFFLNGGAQAVVVRVFGQVVPLSPPALADGASRIAITGSPSFVLKAASPGSWSNTLIVNLIKVTDTSVAPALGLPSTTELFDIVVKMIDPNGATIPGSPPTVPMILLERIRNVSLADNARKIDRVLPNESRYLLPTPSGTPAAGTLLSSYTIGSYPVGVTPGFNGPDYTPAGPGAGSSPGADSLPVLDTVYAPGGVVDTVGKTGIGALEKTDIFNLLCIPPEDRLGQISNTIRGAAAKYCADRRAIFIVDPPTSWQTVANVDITSLGISGLIARNAAVYFPRITQADPLRNNQLDTFVPCGTVAGAIASTDARRGVFKAPAGIDVGLTGVRGLSVISGGQGQTFSLSDAENGQSNINPSGVNCIRIFPVIGPVLWGARTARGADQFGDDYKYLPVRRLALFIEESLFRGTKFAVFEPNDEPLWSQIRLNVGAFMQNLFRQGAFQGQSPKDAYFVKCDKETTTQNDINLGIVNVIVAFAPLKPAEFVVIKIQQIAGQIST